VSYPGLKQISEALTGLVLSTLQGFDAALQSGLGYGPVCSEAWTGLVLLPLQHFDEALRSGLGHGPGCVEVFGYVLGRTLETEVGL